ncbi:MAG TPA: C39 family peptidase [Bacillota bacterium]|nr:C39 family peptidase [Bacillota bacterium]
MKTIHINNVPTICQHPEMPTGCEATALTMLLNWGGKKVSNHDVVKNLPKGDSVKLIDGEWRGGNPTIEFVGDPYGDEGNFGVFEGPILKTIETIMPGKGVDLTGRPFEELLDIVRSGKPVMAWTTIEQQTTFHSKTWKDKDGNTIKWYRYEHAVVLVGFNEETVFVNDPTTGKEEQYDREQFERNWASMGKRAVTLTD